MAIPRIIKDPDAFLDYVIDWSRWLASAGDDTITDSTWIVPDGVTLSSDSFTTTTATAWLADGEHGENYIVTNRITTAGGRTEDQSFTLVVLDR